MGKDLANGAPQQRQLLLGNLLDKMKACPRSSLQTSLSVPFLLSMSHTSPPRVHQPLERRREGMMRTVREGMWNKCNEQVPCSDVAWSHLKNLLLNCQVLLEAAKKTPEAGENSVSSPGEVWGHLAASPWDESGDGKNAIHAHRYLWFPSQRPCSRIEIWQMCF